VDLFPVKTDPEKGKSYGKHGKPSEEAAAAGSAGRVGQAQPEAR